MRTSCHNHTLWSDGSASVARMVEAARAAGLDEIGISDHLVLHPLGDRFDWRLGAATLDEYVSEVRAADDPAGPRVRLALEADFFPETSDLMRETIDRHPFDYVIGSVHFVDGFPIDLDPADWAALTPPRRDDVWNLYWTRVREMAQSGLFEIAAHLDLPKRFGHRPTAVLSAAALHALDALGAAGMAIELNTAGLFHPLGEAYPSPELLAAASERGIPLQINSDAHDPDHVARGFERGRELALAAGYMEVVRFARRRRYSTPL
jgi:histidinol-phosphatase (PHP family)